MPLPWLVWLAIGIAVQVVGYLLMPKPKEPKPPELDDFEFPTSQSGRARPVVFGSMEVKGLNLLSAHDKQRNSRKT